jgi:hypothetical protein
LEVSAHSDQSGWLIAIDMDMGIKGSNNEPRGTNKMAPLDAHSHDKDNGDISGAISGAIEVTAVFVVIAIRAAFCSKSIACNRAARLRRRITFVRG